MDSEDLARRLRAARALTPPTDEEIAARPEMKRKPEPGITIAELALRINEEGLGDRTLGKIERGERGAPNRDRAAIAQALGLPAEFFLLDYEEIVRRLGGAGAPGIPGATGHRVGGLRPSQEDPLQPGNDEEEERSHAEP